MIGYAPRKSGSSLWTLAATRPIASAWFPVTLRYVPGASFAGLTSYCDGELLGRLAEGVAGLERVDVRLGDLRLRRELLLEERDRALGRAAVEPRHEAEREHVLRALRLALRDLELLERLDRQRRERHGVHLVLVERAVLERVGRVARLLEVALGERVRVDDDRRAARQVPAGSSAARPGSSPRARSARRPA